MEDVGGDEGEIRALIERWAAARGQDPRELGHRLLRAIAVLAFVLAVILNVAAS